MGNLSCCTTETKNFSLRYLGIEIPKSIERSDLKSLNNLLDLLAAQNLSIDSTVILIKDICLNPISYSVFTGKKKAFKFFYDKGADIQIMNSLLYKFSLTPIEIICERGYLELLEFYLPIYLKQQNTSPGELEPAEPTLNLLNISEKCIINSMTPIQKACEKGHISIVMYLYKYFKSKKFLPVMFDLDHTNEKTGENCALIACRKGNYNLMKALHTLCNADFKIKNRYDENALLICVCAYRIEKNCVYIECIKYLIQKIGIDVAYMHEELLMLSECEELTYLLEQQLQRINIFTTKQEIEDKYRIKRAGIADSCEVDGSISFFNANFQRYLEDDETKSRISSISQTSNTDLICSSILC